jgi:hypothetical protein
MVVIGSSHHIIIESKNKKKLGCQFYLQGLPALGAL